MKKPALPLWYFWTNAAVQYDRLVWWGCTPNYHDLLYHQLILNLVQHWQQLRLSWTDFPTKHIQQDNLWNQGIPELGNLCHGAFYAKFVNRLLLHIYIYIYIYVCMYSSNCRYNDFKIEIMIQIKSSYSQILEHRTASRLERESSFSYSPWNA